MLLRPIAVVFFLIIAASENSARTQSPATEDCFSQTLTGLRMTDIFPDNSWNSGEDVGTVTPDGALHLSFMIPFPAPPTSAMALAHAYVSSIVYTSHEDVWAASGWPTPLAQHVVPDKGATGGGGWQPFPYCAVLDCEKTSNCATPDPDPRCECAVEEVITGTGGATEFACVCAIVSGSNPAMPQPPYELEASEYGPPRAQVYSNPYSGARAYKIFPPAQPNYVEIRHTDGTVARFDTYKVVGNTHRRRLTWVRDPFDNQIDMFYGSDGKLEQIRYPNGVTANWNWSPSWITSTSYSGVEVTYTNISLLGNLTPADLTWAMVFQTPPAGPSFPFAGDKLYRVFYPKEPYLADPLPASLYDVSTKTSAYLVYEFSYTNVGGQDRITSVSQYRNDTITIDTLTGGQTTASIGYAQFAGGQYRVSKQTNLLHGGEHTFSYITFTGSSDVQFLTDTNPIGTQLLYEFDTEARPLKVTITPEDNYNGRPRKHDPENGQLGPLASDEPASATWTYTYDANCSCRRPRTILSPGGYLTEYEWDAQSRLLRKKKVPNPSTEPSAPPQVEYTYDWTVGPATGYSAHYPLSFTRPYGAWTTTYEWAARQDPAHGFKPTKSTQTSPSITIDDQGTTETITQVKEYSPQGLLTRLVDFDGQEMNVQHWPNMHPNLVDWGPISNKREYKLDYDDWGNLVRKENLRNSSLALIDTFDVVASRTTLKATAIPSTGPFRETEFYLDRWGNTAVSRTRNLKSDGTGPTAHGEATSSARPFVRDEHHYLGARVMRTYQDRRPLNQSSTGPLANDPDAWMLETSYAYRPDGVIAGILKPNGAYLRIDYDGYGRLYKRQHEFGAAVSLDGKYFVDQNLDLTAAFVGDVNIPLWTDYEHNGAGAVVAVVEASIPTAPEGYLGSLGGAKYVYELDAEGRLVGNSIKDGSAGGATELARVNLTRDELGRIRKIEEDVKSGPTPVTLTLELHRLRRSQMRKVVLPGGYELVYDYNASGLVEKTRDSRAGASNETIFQYISKTKYLSSKTSKIQEENLGGTVLNTYVREYEWNDFGQLAQVRNKGTGGVPLTSIMTYYTYGSLESYTDAEGTLHKYVPDALGRDIEFVTTSVTGHIRNLSSYSDWVGNGRTAEVRYDGRDLPSVTSYDFAGRAFLVQHPGADLESEPTLSAPHKPFSWFAAYDAANRVATVFDGQGVALSHKYDGSGRLIVREAPGIDLLDSVSGTVSREVLNRDRLGRITSATSHYGALGPTMATFSIAAFEEDSAGRVHKEKYWYAPGAAQFEEVSSLFDDSDFRTDLTYPSGLKLEFLPDSLGELAELKWERPGATNETLATYGHAVRATSYRDLHYNAQDRGQTAIGFDSYGRRFSLTDTIVPQAGAPNEISGFLLEYDAVGNVRKKHYAKVATPSAVGDRFIYDEYHRLTEAWLGVDQQAMSAPEASLDPTTSVYVKRSAYTLDASNNWLGVVEQGGPSGTPTTTGYAPEANSNRYSTVGGAALQHDNRGNLVYDGTFYWIYDFRNRLSEVYGVINSAESSQEAGPGGLSSRIVRGGRYKIAELEAARREILAKAKRNYKEIARQHRTMSATGVLSAPIRSRGAAAPEGRVTAESGLDLVLIATYTYDPFSRRVIRAVVGDATYLHAYDKWREVQEFEAILDETGWTNDAVRTFVWGDRLDELVVYRRKNAAGQWEDYFAHQGPDDSVVRLVDPTPPSVTETVEYDQYGNPAFFSGGQSQSGSSVNNPYLWKGHRRDSETGLVYMRHRYYSPTLGRFLSVDPPGMWFDGGNRGNGYAFAANNPTSYSDRYGLLPGGEDPREGKVFRRGGKLWVWLYKTHVVDAVNEDGEPCKKRVPSPKSGRWVDITDLYQDRELTDRERFLAWEEGKQGGREMLDKLPDETEEDREQNQREAEERERDFRHDIMDWWNGLSEINRLYIGFVGAVASAYGAGKLFKGVATGIKKLLKKLCFGAGTVVLTASGVSEIQDIRPGDRILARHELSGEFVWAPVTEIHQSTAVDPIEVTLRAHGGLTETITVTSDHPFAVLGKGWSAAGALVVGDRLISGIDVPAEVVEVTVGTCSVPVFNLTVEGAHTYFVGRSALWVHNDCKKGRQRWGRGDTLDDHFKRHGADFGAKDADDYAQQAADFLDRARAQGLPTKIDQDGVIRVFDPKSNSFAAYNSDGTTRTFFKPTSSTYWQRQPGTLQ